MAARVLRESSCKYILELAVDKRVWSVMRYNSRIAGEIVVEMKTRAGVYEKVITYRFIKRHMEAS